MRRYASENIVGLQPNLSQSLHRSHQLIPKSLSASIVMPQDVPISSKMSAIIKKTHEQSQMLKGRLSALQIQQQKNAFKAKMNNQKFNFHQHMRAISQIEEHQKAEIFKKIMQKLSHSKQTAQNERIEHKLNLKKIQSQILNKNTNEYKKSKEKAKQMRTKIINQKRQQENLKKQRVEEIKQYKKMQRKSVDEFLENKKKTIKQADSSVSLQLSTLAQQRRRQIYELAKLQSQMLQRQARSKQISQYSQNKLKKLFQSNNQSRSSQRSKLPSINAIKKQI